MLGVLIRNSPGAIVGLLRLLLRAPDPLDAAGQLPAVVGRHAALAGLQLGPGRAVRRQPDRRASGRTRDLRPDLAGRPPGRRPGDGDAVRGEVAPSRPPGRTTRTPGEHSAGGPRTSLTGCVTSGRPPPVVGRDGRVPWLPSKGAPPPPSRPARPGSARRWRRLGGRGRARLRGRDAGRPRPRTSSCSTTASSTRSPTTCWSARAPCCGGWRSRSPTPRATSRRAPSSTRPPTRPPGAPSRSPSAAPSRPAPTRSAAPASTRSSPRSRSRSRFPRPRSRSVRRPPAPRSPRSRWATVATSSPRGSARRARRVSAPPNGVLVRLERLVSGQWKQVRGLTLTTVHGRAVARVDGHPGQRLRAVVPALNNVAGRPRGPSRS